MPRLSYVNPRPLMFYGRTNSPSSRVVSRFPLATQSSRPGARRAFTLIELLAVILVVGILTALLAPVGSKMVGKSQSVRCSANLRQIGTAIQLYAADHDGEIVPWRITNSAQNFWAALLLPYLGADFTWAAPPPPSKSTVFMCPTKKAHADGTTEYKTGNIWSRYNINLHIAENAVDLTPGSEAWSPFRKTKIAQIDKPSKTYIVMDLFGDGGGGFWCTSDGELTYPHDGKSQCSLSR